MVHMETNQVFEVDIEWVDGGRETIKNVHSYTFENMLTLRVKHEQVAIINVNHTRSIVITAMVLPGEGSD